MRLSLLSSRDSTSSFRGFLVKKYLQQPCPGGVRMLWSLIHSPSGMWPTFWTEVAGTLYGLTVLTVLVSRRPAPPLFSDCVWVSAQTTRFVEVPMGLTSLPASELRKYSVPPSLVAYWLAGLLAGQTVNPARRAASVSRVSNCTTVTLRSCRASARFENA